MSDLQSRIGKWHRATFGECTNVRIGQKLLEEAGEFLLAQGWENAPVEAADCYIVLLAWCERNDVDLEAEAERKFNVVQQRDQAARDKAKGLG